MQSSGGSEPQDLVMQRQAEAWCTSACMHLAVHECAPSARGAMLQC